jgi:DNA-binding PadR family transcriptional regulator
MITLAGNCVQRDLSLALIRIQVLHQAVREPVFGLGIMENLGRHGYKLSAGTVYPILHGMEKDGLLRSRQDQIRSHFRRVYRATPQGRKVLEAAKMTVQELLGELLKES